MVDYLKIYPDMEQFFDDYTDEQRGRLMMGLFAYAFRGEQPTFSGNEKFIWKALKRHIDASEKASREMSERGKLGGRPKKTQLSEKKHSFSEKSLKMKMKVNNEDESKSEVENESIFITDDDLISEQQNQAKILNEAQDAGFQMNNTIQSQLIDLYGIHGLENMINALRASAGASGNKMHYLQAVLNNGRKQESTQTTGQDLRALAAHIGLDL